MCAEERERDRESVLKDVVKFYEIAVNNVRNITPFYGLVSLENRTILNFFLFFLA